jgi:hypothetical protein
VNIELLCTDEASSEVFGGDIDFLGYARRKVEDARTDGDLPIAGNRKFAISLRL